MIMTDPHPKQTSSTNVDILVVGAGISASALSFTLHKKYPELEQLVTEARPIVGGNVISCSENGYTWEEGPSTFRPTAHMLRLAVDLGLKDDIVFTDDTLPRFVYWDGQLFSLPRSLGDIPTFRLLSFRGMIRACTGAMGLVAPKPHGEESVKEFFTRHFGTEVVEKMIDPFVSGVYAGDPSELSMSAAFRRVFALQELGITNSIIEGALIKAQQTRNEQKTHDASLPICKPGALASFREGLSMLPKTVAERLGKRVRLRWTLLGLTRQGDGRYVAQYDTPMGLQTVVAEAVALTVPAPDAARILRNIAPGIESIGNTPYPTVWSVTLSYPKSEFKEPLTGFGNLIPRSTGIRTLGTIWSSCLFPGRAPEDMELLQSYIGGAQDPKIKDLSKEEVVQIVDEDIKKILLKEGCNLQPVVLGARRWERAIPQYNIGYLDAMSKAEKSLEGCEGLFLGGNYASGISLGDCVLWGIDTAPKIAKFVKQKQTGQKP